jgi:hypothetical protein
MPVSDPLGTVPDHARKSAGKSSGKESYCSDSQTECHEGRFAWFTLFASSRQSAPAETKKRP